MHEGHRKRMLRRLEEGAGALQDHELFEILLYNAIPRKNTNPLAHDLLFAFGSMDGVFHATYEQLLSVDGVGPETAAYLRSISIICERMRFTEDKFPKKIDYKSYADFFTERFKGVTREVIELFALDSSEHLMNSKRFTSGSIDKASVNINDLSLFLATNRPHGIVLVHNHPNAPSISSLADDAFTARIAMLCSMQNVRLFDHMIVGNDGVYSYFMSARLEHFTNEYCVDKFMNGNKRLEESKRRN